MSKTGLIPAKAFEHERHYLKELSRHLPPPYQVHPRATDQYGYVAFNANYYWVPGDRCQEVKLLEYADHLKIFQHRNCLAEYPLPAAGVRNQRFSPPGQPQPRYQPRNRRPDARQEEQRLRAMGSEVQAYLDYALQAAGIQRHRFTRELLAFSRRVTQDVFVQTLQRALRYRIVHLETLRRIAWLCMQQEERPLPEADVDENFHQRPAYQEGCLTEEPDLSIYDTLFGDEEQGQQDEDTSEESENENG